MVLLFSNEISQLTFSLLKPLFNLINLDFLMLQSGFHERIRLCVKKRKFRFSIIGTDFIASPSFFPLAHQQRSEDKCFLLVKGSKNRAGSIGLYYLFHQEGMKIPDRALGALDTSAAPPGGEFLRDQPHKYSGEERMGYK